MERRRPPLLPDTPPAHVHRRRHLALDVRDRLGQPRGQGLPGHGVGLPRHRAGVQQLPRRVLPQSALEHVPGHRGSRDAVQRGGARRGGPPGDVGAPPHRVVRADRASAVHRDQARAQVLSRWTLEPRHGRRIVGDRQRTRPHTVLRRHHPHERGHGRTRRICQRRGAESGRRHASSRAERDAPAQLQHRM